MKWLLLIAFGFLLILICLTLLPGFFAADSSTGQRAAGAAGADSTERGPSSDDGPFESLRLWIKVVKIFINIALDMLDRGLAGLSLSLLQG